MLKQQVGKSETARLQAIIGFPSCCLSCRAGAESLTDQEKLGLRCEHIKRQQQARRINHIAAVFFVNACEGPLAVQISVNNSFFAHFAEIGSHHAREYFEARTRRAGADPAAAVLRAESNGTDTNMTEVVRHSIRENCESILALVREDRERLIARFDALLQRVDALEGLQPGALHISLNSSTRDAAQARLANLRQPANRAEAQELTRRTLLISTFISARAREDRPTATDAQRKRFIAAIKSAFSYSAMNAVRRRQRERGEAVPRAGQIARSQYHYVTSDEALLRATWEQLRDLRDEYWERVMGRSAAPQGAQQPDMQNAPEMQPEAQG